MQREGRVVTVPIFGLLGLLFIGLKLTGYITWSWWAVLLPFYGPLLVVLVFLFLGLMFYNMVR
jgi:hypothetical protein